MSDINATIKELTARRSQLSQEIEVLDGAITALLKISGGKASVKKTAKALSAAPKAKKANGAKRNMSAAARNRIRDAQKKRWAAFHAAQEAKAAK